MYSHPSELPSGWSYDTGDRSVGIWDGFVHDACPADYEQGVWDTMIRVGEASSQGYAPFRVTLECRDCNTVTDFMHAEFVGFPEEDQ